WPKGADCKSAGSAFDGSNPSPSTIFFVRIESQLIELAFYYYIHRSHRNYQGNNIRCMIIQSGQQHSQHLWPLLDLGN
ncbi:hypothetical protein, partial [Vibrio vulnificus]